MAHWTYEDFKTTDDLRQGDILRPNADLLKIFNDVHPHFVNSKYLGFIVTSQSCDLATRENNACSAHHINIAAVRSLSQVFLGLLESECSPIYEGVYNERDKNKVFNLVNRIFNQNEQKIGLFYLFPDASVEFGEDAVAFLRVSVAVKREHYKELQAARCGRLQGEFANKLGWLVGNLYSRIGTKDWPSNELKKKTNKFISQLDEVNWIPEHVGKYIAKNQSGNLTREEYLKMASGKIPTQKEKGIEKIIEIISKYQPSYNVDDLERLKAGIEDGDSVSALDAKAIERLKNQLTNDSMLTASFR